MKLRPSDYDRNGDIIPDSVKEDKQSSEKTITPSCLTNQQRRKELLERYKE